MLKRVAAIRSIRTRWGGAGIAPGRGAGKALAGSNCASCACPPSAADRSAHARRSSGKSGARKSVDFDSESPICTGESAIRAGEGRLSLLCDLDPGHHSPYRAQCLATAPGGSATRTKPGDHQRRRPPYERHSLFVGRSWGQLSTTRKAYAPDREKISYRGRFPVAKRHCSVLT